jgi:ABC-type bacteriocin/lantibiotic exporter with double-glycine peptidase domain
VTGLGAALLASAVLSVPYVAQQKDTCAAAALAMVLHYWDADVPQDEIASLLDPQVHGILGSRLERFARERGFTAVAYASDLPQLHDYIAKGRPLIVAWKVGRDQYHNVVVVGFDDATGDVIVNDPGVGAFRAVSPHDFERRWAGAGHWTLLVLPRPGPGEP